MNVIRQLFTSNSPFSLALTAHRWLSKFTLTFMFTIIGTEFRNSASRNKRKEWIKTFLNYNTYIYLLLKAVLVFQRHRPPSKPFSNIMTNIKGVDSYRTFMSNILTLDICIMSWHFTSDWRQHLSVVTS